MLTIYFNSASPQNPNLPTPSTKEGSCDPSCEWIDRSFLAQVSKYSSPWNVLVGFRVFKIDFQ